MSNEPITSVSTLKLKIIWVQSNDFFKKNWVQGLCVVSPDKWGIHDGAKWTKMMT